MATPILFLFLFLSTTTTTSLASEASKDRTALTFIRTSCNASTSYPSLCYAALAPYASAVQSNMSPLQLALVATNASLPSLQSAADKSASLYEAALAKTSSSSSPSPSPSRSAKALKDCRDVLRGALDNTKYSLSQLREMKGPAMVAAQRMWVLSNAQTYMSAALTKEDTCIDGLKEMGASAKGVSGRVLKAEKYTSNALGLVNVLSTLH